MRTKLECVAGCLEILYDRLKQVLWPVFVELDPET